MYKNVPKIKTVNAFIRSAKTVLAAAGLSAALTSHAFADQIVAPGNYYIGNVAPFGGLGDGYYQQMFDSRFFDNAVSIGSIGFIKYGADPADTGFAKATYKISFSTVSFAVGGLSATDFQGNLGTNDTVFFAGTLDGGTSIVGSSFVYKPVDGNLLMSVQVSDSSYDPTLLGHRAAFWRADVDLGTSRAWYFPEFSPEAYADNRGLNVVFDFTNDLPANDVPEPSTLLLLGAGILALIPRRALKKEKS